MARSSDYEKSNPRNAGVLSLLTLCACWLLLSRHWGGDGLRHLTPALGPDPPPLGGANWVLFPWQAWGVVHLGRLLHLGSVSLFSDGIPPEAGWIQLSNSVAGGGAVGSVCFLPPIL